MPVVPEKFRPALRYELDLLVDGRLPDLLTWVRDYGGTGATLVHQPEEIWTHADANFYSVIDGSFGGELPLWTTDESPSDLSVEFVIDRYGVATLTSVHVL